MLPNEATGHGMLFGDNCYCYGRIELKRPARFGAPVNISKSWRRLLSVNMLVEIERHRVRIGGTQKLTMSMRAFSSSIFEWVAWSYSISVPSL